MNKLCKRDSHILTRPQAIFDRLSGKKIFSQIDLDQGFYQIPLEASSKACTTFCLENPSALYEWTVAAMGCVNTPTVFMRCMNHVIAPVVGKSVEIYVDDILVYSDSLEEHLQHLKEVFDLITKAGMTL